VKLVLEYDGTDFAGWQRQPDRRTVQEVLERAIAETTGEWPGILASGRTDSGVHAKGQVANFRTHSHLPPERLMMAINARLPEDVAVVDAEDVPYNFHATHDAKMKLYRYRVSMRPMRPVFERRFCLWVRRRLDVTAMKRAAACLVGTHDFNSFRAESCVEKNTVRTIDAIDFVEDGDTLDMYFRGRGFLYMMIRIIVGTLLRVGTGRMASEQVAEILEARDRRVAGPTAAPQGLCLMEVYY
jgi:tRNA pseudouridine38-40 synthase